MDTGFDGLVLTARGHALLRSRLAKLGDQMRSALNAGIWAGSFDGDIAARYREASTEHAALREALLDARTVDSVPADPKTVLVGDRVRLLVGDGAVESRLVVHPLEWSLDQASGLSDLLPRVSTASPLGRALLGRRVWESVEVDDPTGPCRCTILSADRETPTLTDSLSPRAPYSPRDPG